MRAACHTHLVLHNVITSVTKSVIVNSQFIFHALQRENKKIWEEFMKLTSLEEPSL
jgi:hypothetical protein